MAYKTNSAKVIYSVRKHIERYIDSRDFDLPYDAKELAIKKQLEYMVNPKESYYNAARRWVEGGGFLIYTEDVVRRVYMRTKSEKEYPAEKSWELYVHLVARELVKMAETVGLK